MAIESQGFKLEIAGADGGAETITAIALGYPTILTAEDHALVRGDVVTLANFAGADAAVLNSQVAVVQFVTTDTFAVGIDTTGKTITDNTDAATATPKAWTEVEEIVDFNKEDPGANEIDCTHLGSTSREYLMGLQDGGTVPFTVNYDFAAVGQAALKAAKAARTRLTMKATYSDDHTQTFGCYVQQFSGPSAAVDDKLTGNVSLKIDGDVTEA